MKKNADASITEGKTIANPLGIDTTSLGSLKPKDIMGNKSLATTVLSYTRNCEQKIAELETKVETQSTYVTAYNKNKLLSRIASVLSLISTIAIAFGVNFLTSTTNNNQKPGFIFLAFGIVLAFISIVLSFFDL